MPFTKKKKKESFYLQKETNREVCRDEEKSFVFHKLRKGYDSRQVAQQYN